MYLETLQTRPVDEAKRKEFYRIMLEDSDRLLATIEQVLRTGRMGAASRKLNLSRIELGGLIEECLARARTLHSLPAGVAAVPSAARRSRWWATRTKCGPRFPT